MTQPKLKVEEVALADLVPYANNAKLHPHEQVDQIAKSIEEFGFSDPVGVWTNPDGELEIVEGHGRVLAARKLGLETVPVVRLDHLTDEQRRAYVHVHNQTTLNSSFDFAVLDAEIESLGFDFEEFGFTVGIPWHFDGDGPAEFKGFDEDIDTENKCPKCGFEW